MRRAPLLLLLALLLPGAAPATTSAPAPARDVIAAVRTRARSSGKAPLVLFHASWCGWCRKLERTLSLPEVKPIVEQHFELAWLDVQERGTKKALENPGGNEVLAEWGGAEAGLPFYAVLDAKGAVLASALMHGPDGRPSGAAGFPGTAQEIDHFLWMVKKGASAITPSELETLRRAFPVLPPPPARR